MTNRLEERLNKVEAAASPQRRQVIVWRELGETPEQARARHYAARPDDLNANLTVIGWQEPKPNAAET